MIDFLNASVAYEITKKNKEKLSTLPPEVYKKIEDTIYKAAEKGDDSVTIDLDIFNTKEINKFQIDTIVQVLNNNGYCVFVTKDNWKSICYNTYKLTIIWRGKEETNN